MKLKCINKINKECSATGYDCPHAVLHKETEWCHPLKNSTCKGCVSISRSLGDKVNDKCRKENAIW